MTRTEKNMKKKIEFFLHCLSKNPSIYSIIAVIHSQYPVFWGVFLFPELQHTPAPDGWFHCDKYYIHSVAKINVAF